MTYRLIMAMGVVATACLVLGCGGSGDETVSPPQAKAEFIKEADAICSKAGKEREAEIVSWKEEFPGGAAEAAKHTDEGLKEVVAPSIHEQAEQLQALSPPKQDEAVIADLFTKLSKVGEVLEEEGQQGLSHSGLPSFQREAEAYGLDSCAIF